MARCGCAGTTCSCVVVGEGIVQVSGSGSAANPYRVSVEQAITVQDSSTVNLSMSGSGTAGDPYVLSGDATLALADLTDVVTTGSSGDVLALQGDGSFALNPPATASPGVINTGDGIEGDGSGGDPLTLTLKPGGGLTLDATGLAGTWTLMDAQEQIRVDADILVVARGTDGVSSRMPGLVATWTNNSTSNVLVKVVQHGWVRILGSEVSGNVNWFSQPDVVGGTQVDYLTARVMSDSHAGTNIGVYQSYESYQYLTVAASQSITAYARQWVDGTQTTTTLSKTQAKSSYTSLMIYPISAIAP